MMDKSKYSKNNKDLLRILPSSSLLFDFASSFKSVQLAKSYICLLVSRVLSYSAVTTSILAMTVIKWKPTSPEQLAESEAKLLSYMKKAYHGYYVNIGSGWGSEENKIWTIEMDANCNGSLNQRNSSSNREKTVEKLPLVLLHGFGCGSAIWCLNMECLSQNRKIYAFDILGFARSSRPRLSRHNEIVEFEMIESIERWRKSVGLDGKFILCGHSFGGYLSLAYALRFPDHVSHIILADPWGIPSHQTASASSSAQIVLPQWVKIVARLLFTWLNPLTVLRVAGPFGPELVHKLRPDIRKKFASLTGDQEASVVLDYVYHCNAQSRPEGEIAFKTLSQSTGWAKSPMIYRVDELSPSIDLSFIYGGRSWIDRQPGIQIKNSCTERCVEVHVIHGAGHHVYADKLDVFNELVKKTCDEADDRYRVRRAQELAEALHDQD